jgi:hypothetical protein
MAKRAREQAVRERRTRKMEKKEQRKLDAAARRDGTYVEPTDGDGEALDETAGETVEPAGPGAD